MGEITMKRKMFVLISLILLLSNTGCGNVEDAPIEPPSSFAEEFSIREILVANGAQIIANSGREVTESSIPLYHKDEETIVQLDLGNENEFMETVWSRVQSEIRQSGALIHSADKRAQEEAEHFTCQYSNGEISGLINLWGIRGQDTEFTVIALIVESK